MAARRRPGLAVGRAVVIVGGTFIPYEEDGGPGVISGLATAGDAATRSMASR